MTEASIKSFESWWNELGKEVCIKHKIDKETFDKDKSMAYIGFKQGVRYAKKQLELPEEQK